MENKGLLYQNRYVPLNVAKGSIDLSEQEKFKKFYEDKKKQELKKKMENYLEKPLNPDHLGKIPQHLLSTVDGTFNKYLNNDLMSTNKIDFEITPDDVDFSEKKSIEYIDSRYIQHIRTLYNIDSSDRDLSVYPKPNNYKIQLKKSFTNVKRIALRSTEFPNSVQLIKSTPVSQANNIIFWEDEGDTTVYSAKIVDGNYQPNSLSVEIANAMNNVPNKDGNPHNFTVVIDQVTDTVTFSSFAVKGANNVLGANPLEQGIITVNLAPITHGYTTGDTIIVSGGLSFGNIPASEVNGTKIITVINTTKFTYPISNTIVISSISVNSGGNITFSKGSNFRLLFDATTHPNTPASLLGFKLEDTAFANVQTNTKISETFALIDIYPIDTQFTAIILNRPHNIPQGLEVRFSNITQFSDDINKLFTEGTGYEISFLSTTDLTFLNNNYGFDTSLSNYGFKIAINTTTEKNQTFGMNITVTNSIIIENNPYVYITLNDLYPIIIGIYPFINGVGFTAIEMDGTHGFEVGQIITILDIKELLNTTYPVDHLTISDINVLKSMGDPNYDIFDTLTISEINARFFKITSPAISYVKYYRNISLDYITLIPFPDTLTGFVERGSLKQPPVDPDNPTKILTYLTSNSITPLNEGFKILTLTTDDLNMLDAYKILNPNVNINVKFKVLTSDIISKNSLGTIYNGEYAYTRTINQPINLSGDNYFFMTSPQLNTMLNTGLVSNIFAKLTLSAPPGSVIFNSYISDPLLYVDAPLTQLNELEFSFRNKNNELFEFNSVDHSFTIQIDEYIDKLKYNDYDSKRGRYDNINRLDY